MQRRFSFLPAAVALVLFAGLTVTAVAQTVPGLGSITWQKYPAPEGGIIHCIHAQEALVLAGTTEGAYRSDDAGHHWKLTALNRQRVHCFLRLQDGRLLAGTDRGISASTDDGIRWVQLTEQFECTALYEAGDGTLFAGKTMWNKDTVALYTSTDGGASWQWIPRRGQRVRIESCFSLEKLQRALRFRSCDKQGSAIHTDAAAEVMGAGDAVLNRIPSRPVRAVIHDIDITGVAEQAVSFPGSRFLHDPANKSPGETGAFHFLELGQMMLFGR